MNAPGVLLGRLYAMREQLDAVIDTLEQQEAEPQPVCDHPPEKRKYSGDTMGSGNGFTCQQCGAVVTPDTELLLARIVRPGSTPEGV